MHLLKFGNTTVLTMEAKYSDSFGCPSIRHLMTAGIRCFMVLSATFESHSSGRA